MRYTIYSALIFLLSQLPLTTTAQSLDAINSIRYRHAKNGSIALTSWAGANIISGSIGFALSPKGEWKHFHEMNLYWNLVNLGLGIPGLLAKKDKELGLSFEQTVKKQHTIETVFLANGVLDIAYISSGFLLREIGNRNQQNSLLRDRLVGYGNSLIMQGSFLLLFDFIEYGLHRINGKKLDNHWKQFTLSPYGAYGAGLSIRYVLR